MKWIQRIWNSRRPSPRQSEAAPSAPVAWPQAPPARGEYSPLYIFLERRYATTVVLTFFDIEALLGFALPDAARNDLTWWTAAVPGADGHNEAWAAAHRTATPNLGAQTVAFDRVG